MILLTRSSGINSSPRIEKSIDFLESKGIEYIVVGWDRLGKNLTRKNTIYFKGRGGVSIGGMKAAIYRVKWFYFLIKVFIDKKKEISTIHAYDVDTAFPATIFKVLFNKKVNVIFDVCDWFSATLYNQNKFILYVLKKIEAFTIKHSDEVIICEPERINQIPFQLNKKEIIVPNVPSFPDSSFLHHNDKYKFNNDNITLSYVGGLGINRNLEELFEVAKNGDINLLIAGTGSTYFNNLCYELEKLPNVKYFGKVEYKMALNIMYNSDIIYAMYSKANPNHYYAAPNKYYEAMMLGKPVISTKGINMERKVLDNKTGYIIDESIEDLMKLLESIKLKDMKEKGRTAAFLWENNYKDYISNYYNNKYIKLIKYK